MDNDLTGNNNPSLRVDTGNMEVKNIDDVDFTSLITGVGAENSIPNVYSNTVVDILNFRFENLNNLCSPSNAYIKPEIDDLTLELV